VSVARLRPGFAELIEACRERGAPFISPGAVTLPDDRLGFARGLLVRDPDGHVMEVVQK